MIIKSLSRRSNPAQLIKYATRYIVKEGKSISAPEQMIILAKHNIRSNSVEGYVEEFKQNESYRIHRRKDSIVLFHTILSFNPKDKPRVSKAVLKDIANKFIELRGDKALNLAVAHLEKEHTHVHILTSGVQINGRSSRVSKQAFAHILKELEVYQQDKYPELIYSKNSHSLTRVSDRENLLEHFKTTRKTTKLHLLKELAGLLKTAQSFEDFRKLVSVKGYRIYDRNDKPQGIEMNGRKFRFTGLGFSDSDLSFLQHKSPVQEPIMLEMLGLQAELRKKTVPEIENQLADGEIDKEMESVQSIRRKSKEKAGIEKQTDKGTLRSEWGISNSKTARDLSI